MIKIITGAKGTGKTKKLIDAANKDAAQAKGVSAFITDTKRYMYDLARSVRFIDVTDYNIAGEDALCGFVKGIAAGNHDYEYIYIDGIARIAGKVNAKGFTVVPLSLYFSEGLVKAEIALCRGKQTFDKKRAIAEKDRKREMERELKNYN